MDKIKVEGLNLFYGSYQALKSIDLTIRAREITALIGPSGCGKSTLLKSINRMNDLVEGCRLEGTIEVDGRNIADLDVNGLRKQVGMVFQKPNLFPMSIYDNIAYGPRTHGVKKQKRAGSYRGALAAPGGDLGRSQRQFEKSALALSGGQQQRLCIARALAIEPDVLLMDEPTSALDPISTAKVEQLVQTLKKEYTIVIVTHNMQQALRIADRTAFFLQGELVECDQTDVIFNSPSDARTEDYIRGRFG